MCARRCTKIVRSRDLQMSEQYNLTMNQVKDGSPSTSPPPFLPQVFARLYIKKKINGFHFKPRPYLSKFVGTNRL